MRTIGASIPGVRIRHPARSDVTAVGLLIGAMLLVALPVALVSVPPLGDYPGHLSRIFVLHALLTSHDFDGVFRLDPSPVPNLAMDAIILGLMWLGMGAELAGRIFLVFQLWVGALGVTALHAANFRRLSAWPLVGFAFAYNEIFLWGFSNYLFGIGVLLFSFAVWQFLRERRPKAAMAFFVAATAFLYFCHFIAMLFYVALAISVEAVRVLRNPGRTARVGSLPFLGVVLAASLLIPALIWHPPTSSTGAGVASAMAAPALLAHISLGEIWWRLHVLFNFAFSYNGLIDAASLAALAALLVLAWRSGRVAICWDYAPAVIGSALVYFLAPTRLWGTDYVAERMPVFIFSVALAAIDVRFVTRRSRALFVSAVAALIIVRITVVTQHWLAFDRDYAPLMKAIDAVDGKSRIYALKAYEKSYTELLRQGWANLPAYAVIRREAYYSTIFAAEGQNIVVRAPPYAAAPVPPPHFRADRGKPDSDPFDPQLLAFYDYVFIANPALWPEPIPEGFQPVIVARNYGFYRIPKP